MLFSAKSATAVNGPTVYEVLFTITVYLTGLRFEFKHVSIWLFSPVEMNIFSLLILLECCLNIVLIWLYVCWVPEMPALLLYQTTSICPPDVSTGEAAAITTVNVWQKEKKPSDFCNLQTAAAVIRGGS